MRTHRVATWVYAAPAVTTYVVPTAYAPGEPACEAPAPDDGATAPAPLSVDLLLADLRHGEAAVREMAAEWLGDVMEPRAVAPLIRALLHDSDDDVREEAAEALGKIGDRRAIPPLQYAAAHDPDGGVRRDAAAALHLLGGSPPTRRAP